MESILRQLYRGDLDPDEPYEMRMRELTACRAMDTRFSAAFMEKLPESLKDDFITLLDNHLELLPLEMEQNFINGFRLGARLMLELFYPLPSGDETACNP